MTIANDETLPPLIRAARFRLVVLAPAVSRAIAHAIVERWEALGADAVSVILDVDSEVYRLGYGDIDALQILDDRAQALGTMVTRHQGVRVGMVIADDQTLVFSPTPLLVEAGPRQFDTPNAVRIGPPPEAVLRELGRGPSGIKDRTIGQDKATQAEIQAVAANLEERPPQQFDIARTVRVFSTAFEFVEFELRGTSIERKTVAIPKHLTGIADEKTRKQFRQSFMILPPDHRLSGESLHHDKGLISKKYLRPIRDYGNVLPLARKGEFLIEVNALRESVEEFKGQVEAGLQLEMDNQRLSLADALLPMVKRRPPTEWCRSDGSKPNEATLRQFLDDDLRRAFGSAARIVGEMQVRVVFKGVTWEMVNDAEFMGAVREAIPEFRRLYDDYEAARASVPRS